MKIISSGKAIHSPEFYKKKLKRKKLRRFLFIFAFAIVLAAIIYFLRMERFQVSEVMVLGDDVVGRKEIVESVEEHISGNYLLLIPESNAILLARDSIRENILNNFFRYKSVDLNLDGFKTLYITLEERIPYALYCLDSSGNLTTSECYFMDKDGLIFARAPSFSDNVYIIYTTDKRIESPVGKNIMELDEFIPLSKFLETISSLDIKPRAIEIGNDEYTVILPAGGKLSWLKRADLSLVYANLEAFLSDEKIQAVKNFLDRVIYLDLRTENKVFYKLKE